MPVAPDSKETSTTFRRFGSEQANPWHALGVPITANQAPPTTRNGCIDLHRFTQVRWLAILPAGVSCVIHYGRWIYVQIPGGALISQWSEDGQKALDALDNSVIQWIDSDDVGIWIDGITGTIGSGIQMLYKPINRG